MNSIEQNIFETFQHENDDSDDESGYYIANITRRPQELTNELDETNVEDFHNLEVELRIVLLFGVPFVMFLYVVHQIEIVS